MLKILFQLLAFYASFVLAIYFLIVGLATLGYPENIPGSIVVLASLWFIGQVVWVDSLRKKK